MISTDISLTEQLNNKAVCNLHEGKYEQAIKILACALQSTKQQMDASSRSRMNGGYVQVSLDELLINSPVIACADDLVYREHQRGEIAYVYHRAIIIPPSACRKIDYESNAIFGTIVLFNLALSYHLAAEKSPKRRLYLCKAAKLYDLAYRLHTEEQMESVSFAMATINNLGLVHEELHHPEKVQRCFLHILSTMMCLIDCGSYRFSEHGGFIHNASIFVLQNTAAAPAA